MNISRILLKMLSNNTGRKQKIYLPALILNGGPLFKPANIRMNLPMNINAILPGRNYFYRPTWPFPEGPKAYWPLPMAIIAEIPATFVISEPLWISGIAKLIQEM